MTRNKAQKQVIRAGMARTGERYTAARHYALDLHHPASDTAIANDAQSSPGSDLANLPVAPDVPALPPRIADPGVSDEAVQRVTGKGWDAWFALLDAWGGMGKSHPEIARYLHDEQGIDGWWAQSVTVGYERSRGMRAVHQRPDGFSVGVSKTFPVGVERLFAAFVSDDERERWLDGLALRQRTGKPYSTARVDVLPGEARLAVTFLAKGPNKSTAQIQHERLADASDVEHWRAIWKTHLARLASLLGDG